MIDAAAEDSSKYLRNWKQVKVVNVLFGKSNRTYASKKMVCAEKYLVRSWNRDVDKNISYWHFSLDRLFIC